MTLPSFIGQSPIDSASAILAVQSVGVIYNDSVQAISNVSLIVPPRTITSLVGANGAGKTTTLRAISNLLIALRGRLSTGRILFDGRDVAHLQASQLVRHGLVHVPEGRHCFPHLSVEENLLTGAIARGQGPLEVTLS
ncbi:MAG: ATP-binding cassette domain-containing protein [Cyanobacteriota bacterium]|jgi:branched-chain amino acid transport system ATP-binding protein